MANEVEPETIYIQFKVYTPGIAQPVIDTFPTNSVKMVGVTYNPDENGNRAITVSLKSGIEREYPVRPVDDIDKVYNEIYAALSLTYSTAFQFFH